MRYLGLGATFWRNFEIKHLVDCCKNRKFHQCWRVPVMYSGLNMGSSAYFFAKCLSCTLVFGKRLSLTLLREQAGKEIEEAR